MTEETEKIYIIPLKNKGYVSSKAAPMAMKRVKRYLMKHMKTEEDKIWIDESLNNEIWNRGKFNMPNKIRVKAVKFEDGVVEAYLPDLTFEKSRREILLDEKSKKQPILRKEEEAEEELEETETGAEDYEVVPAADGEVKIKKKKQPKEKEEAEEKEEKPSKEEKKPKAEKKETKKKPAKKEEKAEKKAPAKKTEKASSKKTDKKTE
jgi:large subunit ribosomal protein L31e